MTAALLPETIEVYRSIVGERRRLWPLNRRASPDAIRRFALGVGDDNPLWWGDADGVQVWASPTFPYTGVNFGTWPDLGGPQRKPQPLTTLWAGDHWTWTRRLAVDEPFEAAAEFVGVSEKVADGRATLLKVRERVTFTGEDGEAFASFVRTTAVMPRREDAPAAAPPSPLTAGDLERVAQCYDAEPARREAARGRTFADVAVGDTAGPIVKGPLNVTSLVGFAIGWGAPLCPTNRILHQWTSAHPDSCVTNARTGWPEGSEGIHWDPDVFGVFGYDRGFDFGPQRISWVAHLCTDWCGEAGVLLDLDARLLAPNYIGDVTWLTGEVTAARRDEQGWGLVELTVEGRNQRDELTTSARALIALPD